MHCTQNWMSVTPLSGTPNDGEETFIINECTTNGNKLSKASNVIAGNSIYAIIQGREDTDVVTRMDGTMSVKESTTCDKTDITFTFGNSYLHIADGLGSNLQLSVSWPYIQRNLK